MKKSTIYIGNTPLSTHHKEVKGYFVEIEKEKFYTISNSHKMPDFFMNIVSNADHWMFISSNGALTAGRKTRDNALFPYYTVDKIHDYKGKTGNKTLCLVNKNDKTCLWEPFTDQSAQLYDIERNISKSIYGNKIVFEEVNLTLQLSYRYGWYNSEKFGWIKKSGITNLDHSLVQIDMVDGIRNILPGNVAYAFQNEFSNLLDAYKKNELLPDLNLGLFMLSSVPVDRAEPSESLTATSVWSYGSWPKVKHLLSDYQLETFRTGGEIVSETDVRAARGAFYVNAQWVLLPHETQTWYLVAEVNQDAAAIADLALFLKTNPSIANALEKDIALGTDRLIQIVAKADGLQTGNEELGYARHFSNTLFNVMRGGVFIKNYTIDLKDFIQHVYQCNTEVYRQFESRLNALPAEISHDQLLQWAIATLDEDLLRICYEYLPLTFSRRHGDPSRPWNQFSIETKDDDGSCKLSYEGNWRDIFQNWEALSLSFPDYIESIISKFVNASTADGYNPYRITRRGIDWEVPDPNDPWAYIGYWGDHQIIYLQKFLEQSEAFHPGKLDRLLTEEIFVYANVPYRIKPFSEIIKNPKDTIAFDFDLDKKIKQCADRVGSDGMLVKTKSNHFYKVNLLEKILATLLAKLSNFIPEAGIWLNTQRPEWNDANNALVGNGASMVTLCYLYRFLKFWEMKFNTFEFFEGVISEEIQDFFTGIYSVFVENEVHIQTGFTDEDRYFFAESMGNRGSDYRSKIYRNGFSGHKSVIQLAQIKDFITLALKYVNHSIHKNKRPDKLYHAYNLISVRKNSISIRHIDEMLEGQVAILSAGILSAKESLSVLDALKSSKLFRPDQYSYVLYPDKTTPRFLDKNSIPEKQMERSQLLQKLIHDGVHQIIKKDQSGKYHFNSAFRNADCLKRRLDQLPKNIYGDLLEQETEVILSIYEAVFDHQSFTGRSGTFFGYEGLGSIYWHMVSKLLLATQESYFAGVRNQEDPAVVGKIKDHYYEIKAGIGLYKSPELYGAFPTDPYSHTPGNAGAKQPGLTGQVKEDIISRLGEFGVFIRQGVITFSPSLLNSDEILQSEQFFRYYDINGSENTIALCAHQLAFTFCQVPVVYHFGAEQKIVIEYSNEQKNEIAGYRVDPATSEKIFKRTGEVKSIRVYSTYCNNQ
ncbi:MAG: hypothetical protein PHU97_07190 [Bacteroidales bacterium]|nr:hypothetical protein [Bacteroidales bacterium]